MVTTATLSGIMQEMVDLLSSGPTEAQLLDFRPFQEAQDRARELLYKQNSGTTTPEEQCELDQFQLIEVLMRLVKARIHAKRAKQP